MEDTNPPISDKIKKIIAHIKEKTGIPAYHLHLNIDNQQPSILDSKFGGIPYWDLKKEYPVDSMNEKMIMIAQINFSKANLQDNRLPQEGMLQFFIRKDDDVFGINFDAPTEQKDFRIIYHKHIDETITSNQVLALDIPICTDDSCAEYTPIFKEASINFEKTTAFMNPENIGFQHIFQETVLELFDEDIADTDFSDYLNSDDLEHLYIELSTTSSGHWMLGYPFFTQFDPREDDSYFNTLLLQIDSEMIGKEDYILWGDCGVANFFINSNALKQKDFRQVWYNWDCC